MTNGEAKKAVVLNYGMMCFDLHMSMKEYTDFMHRFFDHNPDINHDADLLIIAEEFKAFLMAFQRFNNLVESKSNILKD